MPDRGGKILLGFIRVQQHDGKPRRDGAEEDDQRIGGALRDEREAFAAVAFLGGGFPVREREQFGEGEAGEPVFIFK